MKIKLLVDGGDMKPGPAVSQKLGPMGINIGKVIQDVNTATDSFKGMKVPVELNIDTATKNFNVTVKSPPVSGLLKKELGVEKGSSDKKFKVANASIEQIISIAKTKESGMLAKDFKSVVKSVVGNCVSLGVFIENKSPKEIIQDINKGKYDKEIQEKKTETSEEKRKTLDEFFTEIKTEQDEIIRQEEEEKEKAEEKAAEEKPEAEEAGEKAKTEEKPEEEKEK